jgi:hypothetical protein
MKMKHSLHIQVHLPITNQHVKQMVGSDTGNYFSYAQSERHTRLFANTSSMDARMVLRSVQSSKALSDECDSVNKRTTELERPSINVAQHFGLSF